MVNISENNIRENGENIKKILKGSALSIIITLIGLLIYSIILSYTSVAETTMPTIIIIITGISILIGSTISTSNIKKDGIVNGMLVGLIYITLIYLLSSIITGKFSLNTNSMIMIITSVLTGALGGIIGVNKK
ncbi:MAG: TIGR04086 family membrane protein [Clostridia bacterium]